MPLRDVGDGTEPLQERVLVAVDLVQCAAQHRVEAVTKHVEVLGHMPDQVPVGFVMDPVGVAETDFDSHPLVRHAPVEDAQQYIAIVHLAPVKAEDGLSNGVVLGILELQNKLSPSR